MTDQYSVQRRHPRIFFGYNDKVSAIVSYAENLQSSFSGSILNLSQGGLQLNQKRCEYRGLQPEDDIIIRRLIGITELISLTDIPAKVIWFMDNQYLDHIIMGIAFTALAESQEKTLKSFADTWLALHQQ